MNINYDSPFNFKPIPTITPASDYWQNGTWKFNMPEISAGATYQPSWQDIILHGNTALTLVNAKADSLEYLKLFGNTEQLPETYLDTVTLSGGCEQRNLPSGFTQVESITFDGSSYIDTGIKANSAYTYKFKVKRTSPYNSNIWGVKTNSSYTEGSCIILGWTSTAHIGIYSHEGSDSGGNLSVVSWGTDYHTIEFNPTSKKLIIDGVDRWSDFASTNTTLSNDNWSSNTYNLYLGGTNTVGSFVGGGVSTWAEYEVWNGGTLIQKLVSCKNSSNVVGMYDTVTGNFLTNAGTGTFTAGADVTTPSPDTPMDIVCNNGVIKVTQNLIDLNAVTNGYYYDPQGVYTASQDARLTDYIPVKAGVTYSVSTYTVGGTPKLRYNLFDNNKVWLSQTFDTGVSGTTYVTQVTPTQDGFLRVSANYTGFSYINWDTAKVVYGEYTVSTIDSAIGTIYTDGTQEVVTDSVGNTASAERLLAVGDYKDTQEVLSGSVTRNIGIYVIDGTETWENITGYTDLFYLHDATAITNNAVGNNVPACICSHFKGELTTVSGANQQNGSIKVGYSAVQSANHFIYLKNSSFNNWTANQLKQWLSDQYANGTPVIIVYPLAEATTESVSGQFLSKSPVTQTAGSISNLPIAITESQKTVPTPTQPLQINCNNGVVKVSRNLFDSTIFDTYTRENIQYVNYRVPNGTYTMSTNMPIGTDDITANVFFLAGNVITGSSSANNGVTSSNSRTITVTTGYYTVAYRSTSRDNLENPKDYNWQIEKGSTATPYTPYSPTDIYTDGTTETVEITGKNLFNPTTKIEDYYIDANGSLVQSENFSYSALIPVVEGSAYTWSGTSAKTTLTGKRIHGYNSNGEWVQQINSIAAGSGNYSLSATIPLGVAYIRISGIRINDTPDTNVQLEQGSTKTDYEPYYNGGTATAEMLLKVGTYQDVQSVIDGGVTRNIGIKVLDGTETSVITGGMFKVACSLSVEKNIGWPTRRICTHGVCGYANANNKLIEIDGQNIWFGGGFGFTAESGKQWLQDQYNAGQPVVIVYPLQTPTTETVTAQPMNIQAGTNIVQITQASMDNLELEVKYKAGVSVTITEIQNAQLDDNVEVTING